MRRIVAIGLMLAGGTLAAFALHLPDRHLPDWPSAWFNRGIICQTPIGGQLDLSTGCIQPGIGP